MKHNFRYRGKVYTVELAGERALIDGRAVDGRPQRTVWARAGRKIWVHVDGRTYELELAAGLSGGGGSAGGTGSLRAPMPGQVREVYVKAGASVEEGAELLLLEAMKMELRVQAPQAGKVAAVKVKSGDSVDKDQVLVELDGEDA